MKEYRLWGPPGTGKTTWIARMATLLADEYGPDQVSICSLTNAAVREAIGRDIPINSDNMTTLHARCKRSLSAPPPAEAFIDDFALAYPDLATDKLIPRRSPSDHRGEAILESGFTTYDEVQIARQRMIPMSLWRLDMQRWYSAWSQWCIESGLMDYSSWLETARDIRCLPAQAAVLVDEAQDHTPLQLATIRAWTTRHLILVGDDDQSLYEWSGSVPEEFLALDIPPERERVLEQSYRVPRRVYNLAMSILSKISNRKVKGYGPINAEGSVIRSSFSLGDSREALMPGVDDGSEHMILTSCAYMLNGVIRHLEGAGIQFHNPYRRSNQRWNPLYTESAVAARSYLVDDWTGDAVLRWIGIMNPDVFSDKDHLISICNDNMNRIISYDEMYPLLSERTAGTLLSRSPEALLKLRLRSIAGSWDYYARVFKMGQAISPKVIIGTIHSVKGGESDTVHIYPDVSASGYAEMLYNPDRIHRLFYVAVTRARHSVVIHDSGNMHVYHMERRVHDYS